VSEPPFLVDGLSTGRPQPRRRLAMEDSAPAARRTQRRARGIVLRAGHEPLVAAIWRSLGSGQNPGRTMVGWFMRLLALGVLAGIGVGLFLAFNFDAQRQREDLLFAPSFPGRGLVTNEFAYFNPDHAGARLSTDWTVTSGSLFARGGAGWTGVPDRKAPDAGSQAGTDSAVFRLRSRLADFGNVSVSFDLKLLRLLTTAGTPAQDYDGVHVWLHYQSPDGLYYVSVSRRDGRIVIGKKLAGRYTKLSLRDGHRFPLGRWQRVETTIVTDNGGVTIRVLLNGKLVERVTDEGKGGPVLTAPGRIGLRGDNAEFEFRHLAVRRVS
jgi:Domain of Unknown Function (DUF1080)